MAAQDAAAPRNDRRNSPSARQDGLETRLISYATKDPHASAMFALVRTDFSLTNPLFGDTR